MSGPKSSPAPVSASPKRSSGRGASAPPATATSRGRGLAAPGREAEEAPAGRSAGGDAAAAFGRAFFRCGFRGYFRRRFFGHGGSFFGRRLDFFRGGRRGLCFPLPLFLRGVG